MELRNAIVFLAILVVLGSALAEALVLSRRKEYGYDWEAARVSLLDMVGRQIILLLPLSLATPVFAYAWERRIATISLDGIGALLLLFLLLEFFYYWFHRAAHRVRWFWATHSVHHSPNQLNLTAAYRLGWTGRLSGTTLFFTPMSFLGFHPDTVLVALSLNLLYQFWIHATWIPKLGWLEGILNTPSAHRVHHAANLAYLDANYGGVLIVFDRMFGTYAKEREELPCRYGLVKPVTTYNLLHIEFAQWMNLWRDLARATSLRAFFGYLDRKSTRLNSSHIQKSRMPSSA